MTAPAIAQALQGWFAAHGRSLPWRGRHDPYEVLLSEFILQQTRMEVGLRYFEAILARFPTIRHLARARESSVLAAWSGLGYYSRARNLHKAAKAIVARHGGIVPNNVSDLEALPGIGPYTAGAIASIAYDRPEPSLDGNQYRVLGRLTGLAAPTTADRRRAFDALARRILDEGSPRAINQALMDLGSSVCLPRAPLCHECPLSFACRARGTSGDRPRPRSRVTQESWAVQLFTSGDRVWLMPPAGPGLLGRSWLPPMRRARTRRAADLEHVFSHRRWRLHLRLVDGTPPAPGRWVSVRGLSKIPHSSLTRRLVAAALDRPTGAPKA